MDLRLGLRPIASIRIDRFHLIIWITATLWYLLTAFNSSGYYHPDEHYQLIEFARYKLGSNQSADLAWEFNAGIRSALQPAICFAIFNCCNAIGIEDPYLQSFILRILTALLSLVAIQFFVRKTITQFPIAYHKAYIVLSYFLWFLPFINVRFSSETWSGIFILLAVSFVQDKHTKYVLAGACMGLSFLCRFQAGVMDAGLILWLLCIRRIQLKALSMVITGLLLTLGIGMLLDTWMYGKFTWTAWNYFQVNILQDVASRYGTSPWYRILVYMLQAPGLPLGILILSGMGIMWIYKPRHPVLWVMTPLLLVHAFIPHKELRFLFPLVNFIPVILIWTSYQLIDRGRAFQWLYQPLLFCLVMINITGLIALTSKAAGAGRNDITTYIFHHWKQRPIVLLYEANRNPYRPWSSLREGHYEQGGITFHAFGDLDELADMSRHKPGGDTLQLIIVRHRYWDNPWFTRLAGEHYARRLQAVPEWVLWLNKYYREFKDEDVMALYEMQPDKH